MATGRVAAINPSATTNTTVYTCPGSTKSVATISLTNRSSTATAIRLWFAASDSPLDAEAIFYDFSLEGNSVEERTVVMTATQRFVVYTANATLSVVVWAIEEAL